MSTTRGQAASSPVGGPPEMFELFTARARRVIVLAQEEARDLGHNYLGTEHLLIAILNEGEGVAVQSLERLDVSLADVRVEMREIIGYGNQSPDGQIPFTPRAKKVLEFSLRESLTLGHDYVGTEHLLTALIREGESTAARVLQQFGAELLKVRQTVVAILDEGDLDDSDRLSSPPASFDSAIAHARFVIGTAETLLSELEALRD